MAIAVERTPVLSSRSLFPLLLISLVFCASGLIDQSADQNSASQIVLSLNESRAISGTSLTVSFEAVVEDSRCPTGVTCIRAGDTVVRVRVGARAGTSSTYLLRTSGQSGAEIEHGDVRVRLVDVRPYPAADKATRPDEYRLTLSIQKK